MKICTECTSEIPKKANVCKYCGERIAGKLCIECSCYCPTEAKICKWCGSKFKKHQSIIPEGNEFSVTAEFIPTLLDLSFTPQKATFSNDKIIITSHSLFGIVTNVEEIPWEKVAGFSHKSGLIWDQVFIETRGQTGGLIKGISPMKSIKIKQILQKLEK